MAKLSEQLAIEHDRTIRDSIMTVLLMPTCFYFGLIGGVELAGSEPTGTSRYVFDAVGLLSAILQMILLWISIKTRKERENVDLTQLLLEVYGDRTSSGSDPVMEALKKIHEVENAKERREEGRHAETRDMKAEVIAWWEAHKHTGISKNEAAEQMVKLVPLSIVTIRKHLKGLK